MSLSMGEKYITIWQKHVKKNTHHGGFIPASSASNSVHRSQFNSLHDRFITESSLEGEEGVLCSTRQGSKIRSSYRVQSYSIKACEYAWNNCCGVLDTHWNKQTSLWKRHRVNLSTVHPPQGSTNQVRNISADVKRLNLLDWWGASHPATPLMHVTIWYETSTENKLCFAGSRGASTSPLLFFNSPFPDNADEQAKHFTPSYWRITRYGFSWNQPIHCFLCVLFGVIKVSTLKIKLQWNKNVT